MYFRFFFEQGIVKEPTPPYEGYKKENTNKRFWKNLPIENRINFHQWQLCAATTSFSISTVRSVTTRTK